MMLLFSVIPWMLKAPILDLFSRLSGSMGISSIPKSEAAHLANRTEPFLGDEDSYIVSLDVFHQLHCLVCPISPLKTLKILVTV